MDFSTEVWITMAAMFIILGGLLIFPTWIQFVGLVFMIFALWKGQQVLIILTTLPRDIRGIWRLWKWKLINRRFRKTNSTPASLLSAQALVRPGHPCFIFQDRIWTLGEVEEYSWKIASIFKQRGMKHGDVVALFCTNRPEFAATWVGLSRLGVVTALINTNLRQDALRHCLKVAAPQAVIASADLCQAVSEVRDILSEDCQLIKLFGVDQESESISDTPSDFALLNKELSEADGKPITELPLPKYSDQLLYIYTSGTTGVPKAARLLNARFMLGTTAATTLFPILSTDCIYNPLPMYHSSGGILGTGPAIMFGITTVLRTKFSASEYWNDCAKYNCTIGQYIGEMCRYMLAVPPNENDRNHHVRFMAGNGLRPSIWKEFVERFGIKQVCELYGSTEGNINMVNLDGTVGAVGYLPRILPESMVPIAVVQIDHSTGGLLRKGPDNLCIRCKPGEPGMLVGVISEGEATKEYHGYVDRTASEKNVANNVLALGDKVFVSGDVVEMDEKGYLFFKDRTGDTFRWKGENVATAEVEAAISSAVGLRDVGVYGVEIPGTEGRAGMATILDPDNSVDIKSLSEALRQGLPSYAQPIFIRITQNLEMTGTYKLKKTELVKQGYDPAALKDCLYYRTSEGEYQKMTSEIFQDIVNHQIRV